MHCCCFVPCGNFVSIFPLDGVSLQLSYAWQEKQALMLAWAVCIFNTYRAGFTRTITPLCTHTEHNIDALHDMHILIACIPLLMKEYTPLQMHFSEACFLFFLFKTEVIGFFKFCLIHNEWQHGVSGVTRPWLESHLSIVMHLSLQNF